MGLVESTPNQHGGWTKNDPQELVRNIEHRVLFSAATRSIFVSLGISQVYQYVGK